MNRPASMKRNSAQPSTNKVTRRQFSPAWRLEARMKPDQKWMIRGHFEHMFLGLHPVNILKRKPMLTVTHHIDKAGPL